MTKYLQTLAFAVAFAVASNALATTQEKEKEKDKDKPAAPAAASPARTPPPSTALKIQIVLSRYQGEKKISSMPYNLSAIPGRVATLRMGTRIPITMLAMTNVPKDAPAGGPIQYQDVGTNIDCTATQLEDGRFSLSLTVDDSSVYPDDPAAPRGNPSFRSFRVNNALVLRNGETGQFTTATDKVTGETVKVDVTLTVLK